MTGMTTDEEMVTEHLATQLGITALERRLAQATTRPAEDEMAGLLKVRYTELGEDYVDGLVQLQLELDGVDGLDPSQAEYRRGLTVAMRIMLGRNQ